MPETQGPSFIPKRTPTKQKRRSGPRRLYIFSYIAYILIFGAVLTAAGVFVYKLQLETQLLERQENLSAAVNSFSQADLEMVKEFEQRLEFASDRMNNHYALSRIFTLFEELTAATVQLNSVSVTRLGDQIIEVSGSVTTDTFNSTIFQRDILADESVVEASFVEGPILAERSAGGGNSNQAILRPSVDEGFRVVDFTLLLQLDPAELMYEGATRRPTLPRPGNVSTSSPAATTSDNQTGL